MKRIFILFLFLRSVFAQDDLVDVVCSTGSDGFDYDLIINDELTMQYSLTVVDDASYLTARLTYSNVGWVGWALSTDGDMIGSTAVIGLPGDGVYVYDLLDKDLDYVLESNVQDLIDTSIEQSTTETVLEFSRPIESENGNITVDYPQYFLFAYREGRDTLSEHSTRGAFYLALSTCDSIGFGSAAPTTTSTFSPTNGDSTLSPSSLSSATAAYSCISDISEFENKQEFTTGYNFYWTLFTENGEEYIKARIVYENEGWAAIAISPSGEMVGNIATIGLIDDGVNYYNLDGYSTEYITESDDIYQTMTDTSFVQEDGITTIDFTRSLTDYQDSDLSLSSTSTDLYIYASRNDNSFLQHTNHGYAYINLGDCYSGVLATLELSSDDSGLTDAQIHGIIMMVVWFGLTPLAIAIARYGRRWKGWFYSHVVLQATAFALVIVAFIIALNLSSTESNHFSDTHGRLGLTIIIIMLTQIVIALCRPVMHHHHFSERAVSPTVGGSPPRSFGKSNLRKLWELKHQVVGFAITLVAFYNIRLGIDNPAAETTDTWQNIWFGFIIAIGVLFSLLEILKLSKPDSFKPLVPSADYHTHQIIPGTAGNELTENVSNKINTPLIQ